MVVTSCGVSSSMNSLHFIVLEHVDNVITFVFRLVLRKKLSRKTNKNWKLEFPMGENIDHEPEYINEGCKQ